MTHPTIPRPHPRGYHNVEAKHKGMNLLARIPTFQAEGEGDGDGDEEGGGADPKEERHK